MNNLLLITLLILVTCSQQRKFEELTQMWHANVLKHHDKCLKETGAAANLTLRVLPYGEYVDDYKVMCYIACILDNLSVIHADQSIHTDNFDDILYVQEERLMKKLKLNEKCYNTIHLTDRCENAYRVSECIYRSIQNVINEEEAAQAYISL